MIHPIGFHKARFMELWGIPIATDHCDIAERLKTATTGIPSSEWVSTRPSATCAMRSTSAGAPLCPMNRSAARLRATIVPRLSKMETTQSGCIFWYVQELAEAVWKDCHGEGVSHPLVLQAHGDVDGDHRPARRRVNEKIGNGGLAGLEDPAHLRKARARRKRLSERALRIDELLARGIAQNEDVAVQVAHRLPGLAVEGGKIAGCEMRGRGERQHCGLVTRELAVDRLGQGARDVQRARFDELALAVIAIDDQQGSAERGRHYRRGDQANELSPDCHDDYFS